MQYGKVWITYIKDCGENEGGYFCEVYADEDYNERIDYFCIHPEDCDCTNEDEVENFIEEYSQMYQYSGMANMKDLSNEEIFMLSDGLLALIHNCSEAIKLVPDKKAQKGIHNSIRKYQELNSKLMKK